MSSEHRYGAPRDDRPLPSPPVGDPSKPVGPGVMPPPERPVAVATAVKFPASAYPEPYPERSGHPHRVAKADEIVVAQSRLIGAMIDRYVHVATNDDPVIRAQRILADLLVSVIR